MERLLQRLGDGLREELLEFAAGQEALNQKKEKKKRGTSAFQPFFGGLSDGRQIQQPEVSGLDAEGEWQQQTHQPQTRRSGGLLASTMPF